MSKNATKERAPSRTRFEDQPTHDSEGRPSLLTDDLTNRIANEVRMGAKPIRAAALCGVPRSTWYGWVARHESREQPYAQRIGTILLAQDGFDACQEQAIASARDWQARAWLLKTRHRKEYGDKVEIKTNEREVKQLSRAELTRIAYGQNADAG